MNKLILLVFSILLIFGCSQQSKLIAQKNDLESGVITLEDSIAVLLPERLEGLEKDVQYLEGKIELLEEQISFYTDRFENVIDVITINSSEIDGLLGRKSNKKSTKSSKQINLINTPDLLYLEGRNFYIKREFVQAKEIFNEFIKKYPNHELSINCYYWLAEIDYDQEKYADAIKKFQAIPVISVNPEKGIDSLFKIAIINKRQGKYDLALSQAKDIRDDYADYIRIDKVKAFIKELEK